MIPNDIYKGTEPHPALTRAIELAEKEYPELEINIARDGGDVIELFLQNLDSMNTGNCIHASYNKWYDEITFYNFQIIE